MDDPNITMEEYIRLKEEKLVGVVRCIAGKLLRMIRSGMMKTFMTSANILLVKMDDPNITMEEYIRLKEEKIVGIVRCITEKLLRMVRSALSCEPTILPLNDNQIDFRISFDESDDEDYMVIYDKNSFSYKIIYVNDLKMDLENDNDKVNMPSFPSSEPTVSYFDDFNYFKDFEKVFRAIAYNDALTSKLDFSETTEEDPEEEEMDDEKMVNDEDDEGNEEDCKNLDHDW
nr:hypothetical protein [Tanacetum cinerariifolium]